MASPAYIDTPEYRYFVETVLRLSNINLANYKPWQIQRRLAFIMNQSNVSDYRAYADMLAADKELLAKFVDWVTINVSEFYRDPAKFKELQDRIFPEFLKHNRQLKVWSAGCSNGSEPYTLALILEELAPGAKHTIIASDIDDRILEAAARGHYLERDVRNVPKHLREKFFTMHGDEVIISDEIKRRVTFKKLDLLKDQYDSNFDLILCRNVVIYFTNDAKDRIYHGFWSSLNEHGVLFVGGAESILNARDLGFRATIPFFYAKNPSFGGLNVKQAS
ncbi:MAG TPA: protein-glutamate O-methyltransferase CheR [Candidatus Aquicultor sp.]|jgi:chemotaxis protein methyltransferase CheR